MKISPILPRPVRVNRPRPEVSPSTTEPHDHRVIFGRHSTQIPAAVADVVAAPRLALNGIPSQRWVVTPAIEAHHRQLIQAPEAELRDGPNSELKTLIGPMLQARYQHSPGMTIAELGPSTSTTVAQTLNHQENRYIGVDLSEPLAEKQIEFLLADGVKNFHNVKGDTYALPLKSESCDLIVTSCHPPFVSSSLEDRKLALQEVHRSLKPDGEFLLFPYSQRQQPDQFQEYLKEHFQIVGQQSSPLGPDRLAILLKKRDTAGAGRSDIFKT